LSQILLFGLVDFGTFKLHTDMPSTTLLPNTPEYKKAQRQYLKATKNRPVNIDQEWTSFRAAEKKFKARFPPLDLSSVLDLALRNDERNPEIKNGTWAGSPDAVECTQILSGSRSAYIVPQIPGTTRVPRRS
jgi:alkylated DNA repair protein alkB family protein 1